jgi:UDP-N-acetylmuramate--alanine ligase
MTPTVPTTALDQPHFVGIGGAGMSGIARILSQRGTRVAGSDARESQTVAALRALGATVHIGHAAEHLAVDATCVVVSSAIRADNPELAAARERGIPVVHRSDALSALMADRRAVAVAGTHGKTTTTSMLAVSLTGLGLDPSYAIGGDLDGPGTNARHGAGEIFVAEADESDRSFHTYEPEVAIVLNVELDHHANYASMDEIYESFEAFVAKIRPGGTLVVGEHPGARELSARVSGREDLTVVRVGEAEADDYWIRAIAPNGMNSEVRVVAHGTEYPFTVSVPGRHYAHNAVAALAAGAALGVDPTGLAKALGGYTGVNRRLQVKGEAGGVQVVDSYAHHPTEMVADLRALRDATNAGNRRIVVVFQPHLFSRTRELGREMGEALALADASVVLDIYPAREDPVPGVTSALITDAAASAGADVTAHHDTSTLPELIAGTAEPGDLVVTMGAGDVTDLGPRILARLSGPGH